jgi:hypothetical protein
MLLQSRKGRTRELSGFRFRSVPHFFCLSTIVRFFGCAGWCAAKWYARLRPRTCGTFQPILSSRYSDAASSGLRRGVVRGSGVTGCHHQGLGPFHVGCDFISFSRLLTSAARRACRLRAAVESAWWWRH